MNIMTIILDGAPAQGGDMSFIIMMVAIFAIMWFFMIRPQQKKQKQLQNFQNSIAIGTEVVTQGGIFGTVKKIDEATNTLYVEIAKDVQIRVTRNAVYPAANSADATAQK